MDPGKYPLRSRTLHSSQGFSPIGRNAEPGGGPAEDIDGLSDKAAIALLKRRLEEAEHDVQLWKEQAEEARTELFKSKSNVRVP